jgi:hypothetical protein
MWNFNKGQQRLLLIGLIGGGFAGFKLSKKHNINPTISVVGGAIVGFYSVMGIDDKIFKGGLSNMLFTPTEQSIRMQISPRAI